MSLRPLTTEEWCARALWLGIPAEQAAHARWSGHPGHAPDTLRLEIRRPQSDGIVAFSGSWPLRPLRKAIDYRLEMIGRGERWPQYGTPSWTPPPWPSIQLTIPLEDDSGLMFTLQLRHARGWFDGSSLSAEMLWDGGPAEQWSIHGLPRDPSPVERRRAWRTLELLQLVTKGEGGRSEGSQDFPSALFAAGQGAP